jgi:DNA-binding transcriptional ArsR family regulator
MDGYNGMANLFRTIGHPVRLQILEALKEEGESCVSHLEHVLGYPQAVLSQQLSLLHKVGVVRRRREGLNVFYSHAMPQLDSFITGLVEVTSHVAGISGRALKLERKGRRLSRSCTCPKCEAERGGIPAFFDALRERIVSGRR